MVPDLAERHGPITQLFPRLSGTASARYRLSEEQVAFFHEQGYLAGIPLLDEHQIEALRTELQVLSDPEHPGHRLFYEFHSNESTDPSRILFHALGAWRIGPAARTGWPGSDGSCFASPRRGPSSWACRCSPRNRAAN